MTTKTDERSDADWQLPLDAINAAQKERIPGHEDFVPFMLEAWYEGMDVAAWTVFVGSGQGRIPERDAMLHAAKVMCSVGCDYLVLSYDTHATSLQNNPMTGKPWGPNEMQKLCDEQGFCETGQLRDTLMVMVVRRSDKKIHTHHIPYHFHKGEVMYFPEEDISEWAGDGRGHLKGRIPDVLRGAMTEPPLVERMRAFGMGAEYFGFDLNDPAQAAQTRLHMILAGVRILTATAKNEKLPGLYAHGIPATTEAEAEIIQRSAERANLQAEGVTIRGD